LQKSARIAEISTELQGITGTFSCSLGGENERDRILQADCRVAVAGHVL